MRYWAYWHSEEDPVENPDSNDIQAIEDQIISDLQAISEDQSETQSEELQEKEEKNDDVLQIISVDPESDLFLHLEEIEKNNIACLYLLGFLVVFVVMKSIFSGLQR